MDAAAMTTALAQINDKIAAAVPDASEVIVFCECGDCLAESVTLSLDEYEQIRAREDLIFAPGHDAQRTYPGRQDIANGSGHAWNEPRPVSGGGYVSTGPRCQPRWPE